MHWTDAVAPSQIGSANYFWSFPSKVSQARKRKLDDLEKRKTTVQTKLAKVQRDTEEQREQRKESVRTSASRICCSSAH